MRAWEPELEETTTLTAAQHGGWLPENCAEGQQCPLGLTPEVLTLGASLEGSMAGGHVAERVASWQVCGMQICGV